MTDPRGHFIEGPRAALVEQPARAAVDVDPRGGRAERTWERANPRGRAAFVGDYGLVLWNYAVGEAAPKPDHEAALTQFVQRHALRIAGGALVHVTGHASATGSEAANAELARTRAGFIAFMLSNRGVRGSSVVLAAAGERQPTGAGGSGEALARDRRVEIALIAVTAPDDDRPPAPITPSPTTQFGRDWRGAVPGVELRFTVKIGPVEFPAPPGSGHHGTFMVEGEVHLLRTDSGHPANVRIDIQQGQGKPALENWISQDIRVAVGDRSGIGFMVGGVLFEGEYKFDPKWPITFAASIPPQNPFATARERNAPIDIAGIRCRILSGKVRVGFRPSPALTARMARAGQQVVTRLAPWAPATAQAAARAAPAAASAAAPAAAGAGVALAYLGFVAWGLYEFEWAAERGRANAFILDVKRGYARCIAYRGLGMTPTASVVDDPRPGTSAALQLGWSLGDAAWQNLTDDECAIISNEFKTRDLGPPTATELVLDWVGRGYAREPLPDPHVLVRRAAARR